MATELQSILDLIDLSGVARDTRVAQAIQAALEAVSVSHAFPSGAPPITMRLDATLVVAGEFSMIGDLALITMHPAAPRMGLTLLHELGHYLDVAVLGEHAVPASRVAQHESLVTWSERVNQSSHVADLRRLQRAVEDARRLTAITVRLFIWELFARSYAQYITSRSGDTGLSQELAELVAVSVNQPTRLPSQWNAVDFKPIEDAFDEIFRSLDWRHT